MCAKTSSRWLSREHGFTRAIAQLTVMTMVLTRARETLPAESLIPQFTPFFQGHGVIALCRLATSAVRVLSLSTSVNYTWTLGPSPPTSGRTYAFTCRTISCDPTRLPHLTFAQYSSNPACILWGCTFPSYFDKVPSSLFTHKQSNRFSRRRSVDLSDSTRKIPSSVACVTF